MAIAAKLSKESINESLSFKPDVYVDMDGVIADFFSALAKFRGVDHWKDGGDDSVQDSIKAIQGTNFFSTLPVFPTAKQLISTVKSFTGGEVKLSGKSKKINITVNTGGKCDAKDLISQDSKTTILTGGEIEINSSNSNTSKITGGGNIYVYGNPKNIDKKTTFGGKIHIVK